MTGSLWPFCKMTLFFTLLWTTLVFLMIDDGQSAKTFIPLHNSCATHILKYEKQHAIPKGLLHAISKAESGRKDDTGRMVPWPWTINAQGQGYYYPTKRAAIVAVQAMQARGIKSIDVGCMQINLYYHPLAFKNLADAFDPRKNVAYAAHFLTSLKKDYNSWYKAVAYYHSAKPIHHIPYQKTVFRIWNQDKRRAAFSLAAGKLSPSHSPLKGPHIRKSRAKKILRLSNR